MFIENKACRICGNKDLRPLLDLGEQCLTGVFPRTENAPLTRGPLALVKCQGADACGLVQLHHRFDPDELYGQNYGYRSSLNATMVNHLRDIAAGAARRVTPGERDVILDIGSNDGTLLASYPQRGPTLIGMDPSAEKFRRYYREDITLVVDFFSAETFLQASRGRKAQIVTSIAMFYDLEEPLSFMRQVEHVLADEGVWHFEQSYLPLMLAATAYDTVCHEHLEYYDLADIQWMANRAGLRIIDVALNDTNGGSFAVTVAKAGSKHAANSAAVDRLIQDERAAGINTMAPYEAFAARVRDHRTKLRSLLSDLREQGKTVLGYGASTKGNVILQYCGITRDILPAIAEVNEDKFGCFTPGTDIPIISERQAHERKPDYFLVFPWHFRENLLAREAGFLQRGGKMIFPLPKIEVVSQ